MLPDQSLLIETVKNMHHSLSSNMDTSLIRRRDGAFYRSMRGLLVGSITIYPLRETFWTRRLQSVLLAIQHGTYIPCTYYAETIDI